MQGVYSSTFTHTGVSMTFMRGNSWQVRICTHRDKLVEVGAGDVREPDQALPELGPALDGLGAVQEGAYLLLRHAVQLF